MLIGALGCNLVAPAGEVEFFNINTLNAKSLKTKV
jgi:hypothetical protein